MSQSPLAALNAFGLFAAGTSGRHARSTLRTQISRQFRQKLRGAGASFARQT